MLILSRHAGQEVAIGDGKILVTVVEIRGDKVRLGFTADRSVSIHRQEVQEKILKAEEGREDQHDAA